jgi:phosphoglycerate dehydrogenase-like enzyme/glyoxylase-like metal-dependent hydrolase (beta-lactamase superfamily II)
MRSRRTILLLPVLAVSLGAAAALLREVPATKPNDVVKVAEGVYFRHGDLGVGHCNNGFVVFRDFVLVIDANFPSGAEACLADVRKVTDKPVRFVLDTHHHGDHAYGNPVWVKNGAVPIAHEGVAREMARLEPARWQGDIKAREDVRATGLEAPVPPWITFPDRMVLDDGTMRVELLHFGHAHTRGDGFAYLPREKVLFTGDVVVNGPYNFMGDGNTESWVDVIRAAEELDVDVVVPGHGPLGGRRLLAEQREYIEALRGHVAAGLAEKKSLEDLAASVKVPEAVQKYAGGGLRQQVAKVRSEMLGLELPLELERLGLQVSAWTKPSGWTPPAKIVYAGPPASLEDFEAVAPGVKIVAPQGDAEILREAADADAVIGRITPDVIRAGKKLRWVHSLSAGVEQYVGTGDDVFPGIEGLVKSEIILTNARRCHGPNIADQVFAYLLSFTRRVKESIEAGARRDAGKGKHWQGAGSAGKPQVDLHGKTMLIVGLGGIGGRVAERAAAFGMKVLGVDPTPPPGTSVRVVRGPPELKSLLPRADVVVVACPLTRETRGLIGAGEFAAMKDGAYFINIARGRVVDPDALVAALKGGKLAGAGLDVTEPEPLPDSSPLWSMENVIITPHNAGQADGSKRRGHLLVRENIRRFTAGEPLLNVVDKARGY